MPEHASSLFVGRAATASPRLIRLIACCSYKTPQSKATEVHRTTPKLSNDPLCLPAVDSITHYDCSTMRPNMFGVAVILRATSVQEVL
jgi:hypothetical protein